MSTVIGSGSYPKPSLLAADQMQTLSAAGDSAQNSGSVQVPLTGTSTINGSQPMLQNIQVLRGVASVQVKSQMSSPGNTPSNGDTTPLQIGQQANICP